MTVSAARYTGSIPDTHVSPGWKPGAIDLVPPTAAEKFS
jgi:hypothetical protein